MVNDINDPKFAGEGPSAAYTFERNRLIQLGASPEEAHASAVKAHLASVWGDDAKKDRNGKFIPQGIGAPGFETVNHFAGLLRTEGPEAHRTALRDLKKRNPQYYALLVSQGLREPAPLGT